MLRIASPTARHTALSALVLAIALLALAGCGSSKAGSTTSSAASTPSSATTSAAQATTSTTSTTSAAAAASGTPSGALTLEANPEGELKYDKKTLTAKAGKVTIDFTNKAPIQHNMTIESSSGKIEGATPTFNGGTRVLTLNLKPGVYKFFCSVPGHRMAGMEGTLTVVQ